MGYPITDRSSVTYDPATLVPGFRFRKEKSREVSSEQYERQVREVDLYVIKTRRGAIRSDIVDELSRARERRVAVTDRRKSTASSSLDENIYSALWPTVAFSIGLVALLFAIIFLTQGELGHFIPAAFAAFVFISLSYVSMRLRRQVKRAWRENSMTD